MNFTLQKRHIFDGLTSRDATDYAGCRTVVAYHDDFSFSDVMRTDYWSYRTDWQKIVARQLEIRAFMLDQKLNYFLENHYSHQLARLSDGVTCQKVSNIDVDWKKIFERKAVAEESASVIWSSKLHDGKIRQFHAPIHFGASCLPAKMITGITVEALVVLPPRREAPEIYWNNMINLNVFDIKRAPDTTLARLRTGIHELQHNRQPTLSASIEVYDFAREIDAEWSAIKTIENTRIFGIDPTQSINEICMGRYVDFMQTSDPAYKIAPVIDALRQRSILPAFNDIIFASKEILLAVQSVLGQNADAKSGRTSGIFFSAVRRAHENEGLPPLAHQISGRIVEAVEYFSPCLSRDPSIVRKVYPSGDLTRA